jgi:hypothetical protein
LISVSAVPGGNPVAKSDPEGYASEWTLCPKCGGYTCDRCLSRQRGACRCGTGVRLLSEPEQINIAESLMRGTRPVPPSAVAVARVNPPAGAQPQHQQHQQQGGPAASPGQQAAMLPQILFDLGRRIDGELAQNNRDRGRATAALAGSLMAASGRDVAPEHIPWLMSFGESFFRWGFAAEGAEYWKGIYQHFDRHNATGTEHAARAIATAGCFQVLGGLLNDKPQVAQQILGMAQKVYGPEHVLVKEVRSRLGAPASFGAPPAAPPALDMRPVAPRASSATAALDASTKLALWVTLAFLDIAASDGQVGNDEYLVWKKTMANMELPDVWGRFGTEGLVNLLKKGVLQELSVEFASLEVNTKLKMVQILHSFVMADGKAEARELASMRDIGSWLGLKLEFNLLSSYFRNGTRVDRTFACLFLPPWRPT